MSDHADVIEEALWSLEGVFPGDYRLAALDALVAERDEARRELGFKKKALRNCREAHLAAEARVTELEAALAVYVEDDCRELADGEGLTTEEARLAYSPRYRWGRAALGKEGTDE